MKLSQILIGLSLLLLIFTAPAIAGISNIAAFGDSLTDNGPDDGYGFMKFTDGQVWVENLADTYGVEVTDYAVSGSTTTGLINQVTNYSALIQESSTDISETLFTIWSGANNLFLSSSDPFQAVADIITSLDILSGLSDEPLTILVGNLPDISSTPRFYNSSEILKKRYSNWVEEFNTALEGALAEWSDGNVYLLDTYTLFSMYDPVADQAEYSALFYVGLHPSSTGHQLLAEEAAVLLSGNPSYPAAVPVPGSVLLMVSGVALIVGLRRRPAA